MTTLRGHSQERPLYDLEFTYGKLKKKIINLVNPTNNADAANKASVDTAFLKLSGGNTSGEISKNHQSVIHENSLLNYAKLKFWFVNKSNPYVN